jgi:hypothetical protein
MPSKDILSTQIRAQSVLGTGDANRQFGGDRNADEVAGSGGKFGSSVEVTPGLPKYKELGRLLFFKHRR